MIYRLTVATDSSMSVAEIRCLSDHQDQIRALINVNGQSAMKLSETLPKIKATAFDNLSSGCQDEQLKIYIKKQF